jgi:membrane-associated phospholipid phosphatase
VKSLQNKDVKPPEVVRLPELEIHGVWKKALNWISHIRRLYWFITIAVLLAIVLLIIPYYLWMVFWLSLKVQAPLVIMLLIFSLVAVSLVWSSFQRLDVLVLMLFNMREKRAPWLDWMMLGFTQIGNGIFAIVIALVLFYKMNYIISYELLLGTLSLGLVVALLKALIHRTRPYIKIETIRIVGSRASGSSFPSGHTSQAFFMITLLLHYYQAGVLVSIVFYSVALLVGITRIYVGMHYPRDVVGGAILGTTWGLVGVIVNSYLF